MVGDVSSQLEIMLPGDDVRLALRAAEKLVTVLEEIDRGAGAKRPRERARFRPVAARTGSLVLAIEPVAANDAWIMRKLIDGIEAVQEQAVVPEGWTKQAAQLIAEVAKMFRPGYAPGLKLRETAELHEVFVTRAVGDNLTSALSVRQVSIGSVTGRLETMTVHLRDAATLWIEGTKSRAEVKLTPDQVDEVTRAFKRRVVVTGKITRNGLGDLVSIRMTSLRVLPEPGQEGQLTDLIGLDPNFTDGQSAVDYVRELRGAA